MEVSDWRNIEIKRSEEVTSGQVNQAFLRDSAEVVREQGTSSPISAGEIKEKLTIEENKSKLATPPTFAEKTNNVPAGIIYF